MKTIFVDFGNVIGFFDHSRAVRRLVEYSPLSEAELDQAIYASQAMTDYETGLLSSQSFYEHARNAGQLNCSQAVFFDCFADIFTRNEEVCETIPRLAHRYRLVLASNTSEAHYNRYCEDYADVLKFLAKKVASHEVFARKPKSEFYQSCLVHAEAEPGECLFIDDLAKNIAAAEAHGMHGLLYTPGNGFSDKLLEYGVIL